MIMQVHDELLFEAPEAEVEAAHARSSNARWNPPPTLDVPLVVEIGSGDNWMDAK